MALTKEEARERGLIGSGNTFNEPSAEGPAENASFEADEMHDWDSAKLYSKKALKAFNGENLYPEDINYWKIPPEKARNITSGYNNLLSVYDKALIKDYKNLEKQ